jgi:4-hydroxythreonine-4-phosphate dehydrogenase
MNHPTTAPDGRTQVLAVTMGEPAGVGGELTLMAWLRRRDAGPKFLAVDNVERLKALAETIGANVPIAPVSDPAEAEAIFVDALPVLDIDLSAPIVTGKPDPANAPAVRASIETATALALEGRVAGVVTNPIQKATLYGAGFAYPGHTEYLADLTKAPNPPVMMLACPGLRVIPVTIHVGLREALDRLDTALIVEQAELTWAALKRDFAISNPRLAIAGLNPHAGEEGAMGDEEGRIIRPAIEHLRAEGFQVIGPEPPDTLFTERRRASYDAAICMYHDQALIPIKTLDFSGGVNITLGLPIVRTSPDHGTALDLAGTSEADPSSLLGALDTAAAIASNRETAA